MNQYQNGESRFFEAFIRSVQYFVRIQRQQDIWDQVGKLITTYFQAEWVAFVQRDRAGISIHYCTHMESAAAQHLLTEEVRALIADVLDSSFLASQVILAPAPSMTVFLPIVEESQTEYVMMIGHKTADPLTNELLNIYLAIAGLVGTTLERLHNEREISWHRAHLEELVRERTAELSKAKRQNELILHSVGDGICGVDPGGMITFVNQFAAQMLGWDPSEMIGRSAHATFHHTQQNGSSYPIENCLVHAALTIGGTKHATDEVFSRKDGTQFPVEFTIAPIMENENITGAVIVFRDISERKKAEAEIERINRAYKAISRCNERMIHARNEYVLLNDICDIFVEEGGYRLAWIGYVMDDRDKSVCPMARAGFEDDYIEKVLITWADTERGRGPAGTAIRTKLPSVVKNINTDPNFGPWRVEAARMGYASIIGLPLIVDDRAFGVLVIYSDKLDVFDEAEIVLLQELADNLAYGIISIRSRIDRDQAERALEESKAQAELYLDLMGHDINNMHQIALGYLELARDSPPGTDQGEFLNKPIEVLQRSAQLIQNVRKLQKLYDGVFQTELVDVCKLLVEVQREFGGVPHKQVMLNLNGQGPCLVRANDLLHDVFANLVSNAIKHTGSHADIVVALDDVWNNGAQYCRIMVEDDGPGIKNNFKDKIFNRLLKGDSKSKGMGLGLYLVKSLVDSYGGRVWVEDRVPGDYTKGARFVVMLPVAT
jgi:PAS domain S-box-containing protein